jgi:DNA end-binding protein Ku
VDEVTGEEVPLSDIVSGYDLGGEYVVMTRDELREVAPGKSEQIEISDFVDLERRDPVYFRQTYCLAAPARPAAGRTPAGHAELARCPGPGCWTWPRSRASRAGRSCPRPLWSRR